MPLEVGYSQFGFRVVSWLLKWRCVTEDVV